MNVIVVAAIALLVLVVLVAIFSGQMGNWVKGLRGQQDASDKLCITQGGSCMASCDATKYNEVTGTCQTGQKCCVPK